MIKLIATDIDGTLVKDGTLIIDPEYMTVISKLIDKGIIFTVCSGRQFSSEQKLFAPIKDKLMYITDGGTVVRTPDRILKTYPMSNELWKDMCRMVRDELVIILRQVLTFAMLRTVQVQFSTDSGTLMVLRCVKSMT